MNISKIPEGVGRPDGLFVTVAPREALRMIETLVTQLRGDESQNRIGREEFYYSEPGEHPHRDKHYFTVQVVEEKSGESG